MSSPRLQILFPKVGFACCNVGVERRGEEGRWEREKIVSVE
jgi:hypothetical protein